MNTNDAQTAANQMNQLAVDATQTLVDAAYLAQRQSAELLQAWLNTLSSNQEEQRQLAAKLVQQSQEAQQLLQRFVQESTRSGISAFNAAAQSGFNTASETINRASEQASSTTTGTSSRSK